MVRKVEIFSAGCPLCETAVEKVKEIACGECEVSILDTGDPKVVKRAESLGIKTVPSVVIDGRPAECCSGMGIDIGTLRAAGIGSD